jgi:23S rRNA pseudouridine1911/1915/1917 synthase
MSPVGGLVLCQEAVLSRGDHGAGGQELVSEGPERPEALSPEDLDPETLDPETLDPETLDPEALDPEALGPGQPVRLTVPAALAGERVDRAIALLAGISRAQASRLVGEGRVRVGGASLTNGGRRLRPGELLEVEPGTDEPHGQLLPESGTFGPRLTPEAHVIFADNDLVVVDKPAGLVVHPGAGNQEGTLVQQLLRLFPDIAMAGPAGDRPGIVQRLDKGTSGLLVVARTAAAREGLVAQLSARSVERRYLAVVHGELQADEGLVEAPLGRSPAGRLKMAVVVGGREARTRYSTIDRSPSPLPVSLVSCRLETGRTHQVRAHFAAIGHPVFADDRYSKPKQLAEARRAVPELERPWLHASDLGFVHPVTGESVRFTSTPPADLLQALAPLGLELPRD